MSDELATETENEKKDPTLANKVGREVVVAAATTLAGLGTLYTAGFVAGKVANFRARRAEKKTVVITPETENN